MGVFDGIENVIAEGTSSLRQYFEPGNYTVTIERVFLHEKRLGGGKLFIVETKVNESDNPNIKPGEQRNWVQSFAIPSALPRVKSFIGAALGFCAKDNKVNPAVCNHTVSLENPLKGKKVNLTCINKTTQSGKQFTQHVWGVVHG
jgi:hypothetical protein